jgi:RHS repeat-associated protein
MSLTTIPSATSTCATSGGSTVNHSYDEADRLTDAGYVYDTWGRTTTVPSVDAGGSGNLTVGYYANDMVRSMSQGTQTTQTMTWNLDPANRLHSWTDASGTSHVNHYADGSDSPTWTDEGGGAWTRNITGIDGNLAAIQDSTVGTTLQLVNLHGDVVATADASSSATGVGSYFEATEFGAERDPSTHHRYAWLGGKQRSDDTLGNLTLMGARLYDPATGRFLQTDPVPGGSANDYDYADQDPINQFDLDGNCLEDACIGEGAAAWWVGAAAIGAAGWAIHRGHNYSITVPRFHWPFHRHHHHHHRRHYHHMDRSGPGEGETGPSSPVGGPERLGPDPDAGRGQWLNPNTGWRWRWHDGSSHGSHWDVQRGSGPSKQRWRVYPNGRWQWQRD